MQTKTFLALAAGLICCAGTSKAGLSLAPSHSFVSGESFQLGFDGAELIVYKDGIGEHAWTIHSQEPVPANDDGEWMLDAVPSQLTLGASGWYTYQATTQSLTAGTLIDSSTSFSNWSNAYTSFSSITDVFVGISVNTEPGWNKNDGGIYYGWVKLSYDAATGVGQMSGAAMNTTPGQGITAGEGLVAVPEPAGTVGLGGLLAAALLLRNRRRNG